MKRNIICILLMTLTATSFSQQNNPSPPLTKQDYLKKSKNQKTTGFIFLTGGAVLSTTGFAMAMSNLSGLFDPEAPPKYDYTLVDVLGYGGLVIAAASIPFFIASSKNKKIARSISFKYESVPQLVKSSFVYRSVPSLNLKISL